MYPFLRMSAIFSASRTSIFILISILFGAEPFLASAQTIPTSLILRSPTENLIYSDEDITSWIGLSTAPRYGVSSRSEIEDTHLCPLQEIFFCDFSLSRNRRSHTLITSHKKIDEDRLGDFISKATKELDEEPVNAVLSVKDNAIIVESAEKPGFRVDTGRAENTIREALFSSDSDTLSISVPGTAIEPDIKGSDIERLGIKDLIAEGTTNFVGSPKNRVFNINRALKQFQGILIAPNEEFSFVKHLGEVDGEHGYLPELVIKNNRTEPEFGGGICQVSTTVFRTAIYAGLKISARRNHAYPVGYYRPYGMDATIYIPNPDLKFINNTPGYIFLQPFVNGTKLTFQMYGTKDNRTVEVDGPHILESNPDGSMRTVFTQTVNAADGQNFIRDNFWSNYKSPSLFPHPGDVTLKEKPADWSKKQWSEYQKTHI